MSKKPKKVWVYESYEAKAHTKSEARAHFKKAFGLPRLKPGAVITLKGLEEITEND